MDTLKIVNANDDFEVYSGMSMQSLPPHIGYSAVIYATDGNYYRLQGDTFANQVSYYSTSQLQFPDTEEELPVESLLSKPQLITIIPEDGIACDYPQIIQNSFDNDFGNIGHDWGEKENEY